MLDRRRRTDGRKSVTFPLIPPPVTVRAFLLLYRRRPNLRVLAHLLFWGGMYLITDDPDGSAPARLRLLEWGYAAGSFYLLFYGPVQRHGAHERYALPALAALAVGLGTGWLLYWQNRWGSPHSAFARAYLPAYDRLGVLAIFQSVRVLYYALFEGVLANLAMPAALKMAKALYERQLERQHLEQATRRGRLHVLLQQVSPHFLFNTLNNLYGLALQNDLRARSFARQLGALVRHTDELAGQPWVALRAEARFIEDYLALTRLRYDRRVVVESTWHLGPDPTVGLPPLLLLPLVENAVKHGLQHAVGPAWVRVHAAVSGDEFTFSVTNSQPASPAPGAPGGLGLATLRERLRLLYPRSFPLTLRPTPLRFEARLHLPLAKRPPAWERVPLAPAHLSAFPAR